MAELESVAQESLLPRDGATRTSLSMGGVRLWLAAQHGTFTAGSFAVTMATWS